MINKIVLKNFEETISTDVLVIGAGGAGLRAAMEASDNNVNVLVVCKGKFTKTGSTFFPLLPGWGIQFLEREGRENTYDYFLKDIIEVGEGMVYPELAKILIEQTPVRVYELEKMGVKFSKVNGDFYNILCCFANVKRKGAIVRDIKNIQDTFQSEVLKRNIKVIENFHIIKILIDDKRKEKRVCGATGIDKDGDLILIKSKAIILATGGGSSIFRHNLNSPELVGDGYELALDVGASLINMEYIQFIYGIFPKKIIFPEKVFMYNPPILNIYKETFVQNYITENSTIDEIINERIQYGPFTSRLISKYFDIAIYSEIRDGRGTGNRTIYIDLRKLKEYINNIVRKFPWIIDWYKWFIKKDVDIQKELIEIALCAHANNGGLYVDVETMSEVSGLFACGEVMGGPHGADRQGGNMMAATQVFGKIAGENAAKYCKNCPRLKVNNGDVLTIINKKIKLNKNCRQDYKTIKNEIQNAVNNELVICRNENGLKKLIDFFDSEIKERISLLRLENNIDLKKYFDLHSMLNTASTIANTALMREESRGSHHREDYPKKNDDKLRKIIKTNRENNRNIYKFIDSPS